MMLYRSPPLEGDLNHPANITPPSTPRRQGHLDALCIEGALYPEECDQLAGLFAETERDGQVIVGAHSKRAEVYFSGLPDLEGRHPRCKRIPGLEEISNRLAGLIHMRNLEAWHFDMQAPNLNNLAAFWVIDCAAAGEALIGWHSDYSVLNGRSGVEPKLIANILLSDPKDFEGGGLEIYSGEAIAPDSRSRGDMLVYPSFLLHRRLPVTRGQRLACFTAAYGAPFR